MTGPSEAACAMARRLHGGQRGEEISEEVAREAAEAGLVVAYAGDGLTWIAGAYPRALPGHETLLDAIVDITCHDGTTRTVRLTWSAAEAIWTFETEIPHATFYIADGYAPWCRGIVIDLADTERHDDPATGPAAEWIDARDAVESAGVREYLAPNRKGRPEIVQLITGEFHGDGGVISWIRPGTRLLAIPPDPNDAKAVAP